MCIIGIDPGKDGAIVVMNEHREILLRVTMPCINKEFDITELVKIFEKMRVVWKDDTHVFIEDVHAIFGSAAGSTFQFGYVVGAIRAAVIAFGLPHTMVQPKKWQKEIYQGIPEIRKPSYAITKGKFKGQMRKGGLETKKMSEVAAKRLFPTANLKRTERCTINHDGIIDALLIAEYGRRNTK